MFLTVKELKKQLNIDPQFTDDDQYLKDLANVAEKVVEKHIDMKLEVVASKNGGVFPSPLLHAMKLFVANLYENREPVGFASSSELPLSFQYLLSLYKNYSNQYNS